jgi:hypothetical protein
MTLALVMRVLVGMRHDIVAALGRCGQTESPPLKKTGVHPPSSAASSRAAMVTVVMPLAVLVNDLVPAYETDPVGFMVSVIDS